jgi:hypothetical protein
MHSRLNDIMAMEMKSNHTAFIDYVSLARIMGWLVRLGCARR